MDEFLVVTPNKEKLLFVVYHGAICFPLSEYCKYHPATKSYFEGSLFSSNILPSIENIKLDDLEEDGISLAPLNKFDDIKGYEIDAFKAILTCLNRALDASSHSSFLLLSKAAKILQETDTTQNKKVYELLNEEQKLKIKGHSLWLMLLSQVSS